MKTIGLTGGIGMGKSTIAELLRERGVRVADTDEIARELTAPAQPALAEIRAVFGAGVFNAAQTLRRDVLAEKVFADLSARRQLEAILHPRISAFWQNLVVGWRAAGEPLAVVVIPLLFETEAQGEFDCTISVGCSAVIQMQRLTDRGWSKEQIANRLQAQLPLEKKMALASYVVWNDGDRVALLAQLNRLLPALLRPKG